MRTLIACAFISAAVGFGQDAEPAKEEIAQAYRSKAGEGGMAIPGVRWERWRVKEIRGWSLKFRRIGQSKSAGILTRRYQAIAKKSGRCAEYLIVDTVPFPPVNVQVKPSLTVEPGGIKACR